ncbi:helix-turn-helix domain-containing protein [Selenomonadales bacterium OttesenSCG-928-I06]|nr:helix-turn-helix domain-containing protein [Selenomonadales bacterium OttesenSCG-928-I06]
MGDIAVILKSLRKENNLTQSEVAEKLYIDRSTYVKWEKGVSKPTRKLQELANLYNVTIDYLLGYEPQKEELPKDLKKILREKKVLFDGEIVTEKDKKIIEQFFIALYDKTIKDLKKKI